MCPKANWPVHMRNKNKKYENKHNNSKKCGEHNKRIEPVRKLCLLLTTGDISDFKCFLFSLSFLNRMLCSTHMYGLPCNFLKLQLGLFCKG